MRRYDHIDNLSAARPLARAGRAEWTRRGLHTSGQVPYGYVRDRFGPFRHADIVPEPFEAERVRRIFSLYLRLRSVRRVLSVLADEGIVTRRGGRWTPYALAYLLRNQIYVGRVKFAEVRATGRHQRIVAPIVFWKVQKLLSANDKKRKRPAPPATASTAQQRAHGAGGVA